MIYNKILYKTLQILDYHGGESILLHCNQLPLIDSNNRAESISLVSTTLSSDNKFGSASVSIVPNGYIDIKLPYSFQLNKQFQFEAWYKTPSWDNFNPFSFNNEPNKQSHLYDNAYHVNVPMRAFGDLTAVAFYSISHPMNEWFHYAVSFDGQYFRVFINGILKYKWERLNENFITNILVGARLYGAVYYSTCLVDEIKIRLNSCIYKSDSGFDVLQSEFIS